MLSCNWIDTQNKHTQYIIIKLHHEQRIASKSYHLHHPINTINTINTKLTANRYGLDISTKSNKQTHTSITHIIGLYSIFDYCDYAYNMQNHTKKIDNRYKSIGLQSMCKIDVWLVYLLNNKQPNQVYNTSSNNKTTSKNAIHCIWLDIN